MVVSPYADEDGSNSDGSGLRYGERRTCELCGEVRRCFERFDVVTCEECQRELLPATGRL